MLKCGDDEDEPDTFTHYDLICEQTLTKYAGKNYADNEGQMQLIKEFEQYPGNVNHSPIRWYTQPCFLYRMLNKALSNLDIDILVKMAFFIRDLHRNIEMLQAAQPTEPHRLPVCTVYRGKTMSTKEFDQKIQKEKLLSFNNFLSTSKERKVAVDFIKRYTEPSKTSVLFIMPIDPEVKSAPFADIEHLSKLPEEKEILFSTHTIFRIKAIQKIHVDDIHVQEVTLTLVSSTDDQELSKLTQSLKKALQGSTGWHRLGNLLIAIGDFEKAEEVYMMLLRDVSDDDKKEKSFLYYNLGRINYNLAKYIKAEDCMKSAIQIQESVFPEDDSELAKSYNMIGAVYMKLGKNTEALRHFEKSLKINEKSPRQNNHELAINYKNIGTVYSILGKYTEALSCHKKALEFNKKLDLTISPEIASCYINIGSIYLNMGQYGEALDFYIKALETNKRIHTLHHRHLANSYSQVGSVYGHMGKYSEACSYLQKALDMLQNSPHQSHLASCYRNFGLVYGKMGKCEEALSNFENAVTIYTSISPCHPKLAKTFADIGRLHGKMENYSKEGSYYERALDIYLSEHPPNYHGLANSYCNLGMVYNKMEQYQKALSFYQRALEQGRKIHDENDPVLQMYRESIAAIQNKL